MSAIAYLGKRSTLVSPSDDTMWVTCVHNAPEGVVYLLSTWPYWLSKKTVLAAHQDSFNVANDSSFESNRDNSVTRRGQPHDLMDPLIQYFAFPANASFSNVPTMSFRVFRSLKKQTRS